MTNTETSDLDDALDFDDRELATLLETRMEEQLQSGKIREAYYNSYCHLRDLQEFALDSRDMELKESIKMTLSHLDRFHQTLEKGYKWD